METRGAEREPGGQAAECDPRGALLHPAFLLALVLLVINDQFLKGAHLLPGWITGKLSDVAGLVVAPIVLAVLVRARSRHAQQAAHLLVGVAFALTELSQSSADLLAHALRTIGIARATLVADPSDLWALAVLPLPYALLRAGRTPVSRAAPRVSLALALLACIASPQPRPPSWSTIAYLVNSTSAPVDVRIAWTAARPDCAALSTALPPGLTLSRIVDPAIFGDAITFHLDPGATVPIDEAAARAAVGPARFSATSDGGRRDASTFRSPSPATFPACQLVLLRAEGATDRIVLVSSGAPFSVGTQVSDPPSPERAVQLREASGASSWLIGAGLPNDEATAANAPTTCTTDRPSMAFSQLFGRTGMLAALDLGADGCVDARVDQPDTTSVHLFLCGIPLAMMPFTVGDTLDASTTDPQHLMVWNRSTAPLVSRSLTVEGPLDAPLSLGLATVTPGAPESCNGERVECGAFVVPLAFSLTPMEPGDDPRGVVAHADTTGHTQLLVGTSEHVLLAMPGCPAGRDSPGAHAQIAVARTTP